MPHTFLPLFIKTQRATLAESLKKNEQRLQQAEARYKAAEKATKVESKYIPIFPICHTPFSPYFRI